MPIRRAMRRAFEVVRSWAAARRRPVPAVLLGLVAVIAGARSTGLVGAQVSYAAYVPLAVQAPLALCPDLPYWPGDPDEYPAACRPRPPCTPTLTFTPSPSASPTATATASPTATGTTTPSATATATATEMPTSTTTPTMPLATETPTATVDAGATLTAATMTAAATTPNP